MRFLRARPLVALDARFARGIGLGDRRPPLLLPGEQQIAGFVEPPTNLHTALGGGQAVHKDVTYELEQYPEDKTEEELEKHVAPAIRHHMQNFLASIDKRSHPVADIEQGYISTASCILANNSMKLGRSLTWDPEKQLVVADSEANALLHQEYRAPYTHPEA